MPQTSRRVRNLVGPSSMARSHCHHPQADVTCFSLSLPAPGFCPLVLWPGSHSTGYFAVRCHLPGPICAICSMLLPGGSRTECWAVHGGTLSVCPGKD